MVPSDRTGNPSQKPERARSGKRTTGGSEGPHGRFSTPACPGKFCSVTLESSRPGDCTIDSDPKRNHPARQKNAIQRYHPVNNQRCHDAVPVTELDSPHSHFADETPPAYHYQPTDSSHKQVLSADPAVRNKDAQKDQERSLRC